MVYKKKITLSLGHLRPVTERVMVGRVLGNVESGKLEHSQFGEYVRWTGTFRAQFVDPDGVVVDYYSRTLIVPDVASDFILQSFTKTDKTGADFEPTKMDDGAAPLSVPVGLAVYLMPPPPGRASKTGYEFEVEGFGGTNSVEHVLQGVAQSLALPSLPVSAPAIAAPAGEAVEAAPVEAIEAAPAVEPVEHAHRAGKRKA